MKCFNFYKLVIRLCHNENHTTTMYMYNNIILPVSLAVSATVAIPFFGLSSVIRSFVDSAGVSTFSMFSTLGFSVLVVSCFRLRYSLIDSFRFGVTGGTSFCGFNRGSALWVRDKTFGLIGVVVVEDVDDDGVTPIGDAGTFETGVDGSLSVV